eukprot:6213206-Pleurochrysis_carterae.AAC.4
MVELPGLGTPASRCKRVQIAEVSGSDTPADLHRLFPGFELAVESGGRDSLPARTTATGIDSSTSTGLWSATERSLVGAGSAGAERLILHHARQLLVCTRAARCSRGEKHPGVAHTSVRLELKVLSEARPTVPEARRRRGSAGGARQNDLYVPLFNSPLGALGSIFTGKPCPNFTRIVSMDLGPKAVRGHWDAGPEVESLARSSCAQDSSCRYGVYPVSSEVCLEGILAIRPKRAIIIVSTRINNDLYRLDCGQGWEP